MQFQEVAGIIEANKFLIGQTFNGATIDELVCIPVGYEEEYKKLYLETQNAEQTLAMLIKLQRIFPTDVEYQIHAVLDKYRLVSNGVFVCTNINEIIG